MKIEEKKIIRDVVALAKAECANFCDGWCLKDDNPCIVTNPVEDNLRLECEWFADSVLPQNLELMEMAKILRDKLRDRRLGEEMAAKSEEETPTVKKIDQRKTEMIDRNIERCRRCGKQFLIKGNNHTFCRECGKIVQKEKAAKRQREKYYREKYGNDGREILPD